MKSYLFTLLAGLALTTSLFQCAPKGDGYTYAVISTEYGDMKVRLYNSTPKHRDNFIKLANEGFYDSLLFHRVIENFMIQGGDPDSKNAGPNQMLGQGGPGYTLPAEIGKVHFKGALAAARLGDRQNPQRNSSGSQFYIVDGQPLTEENIQNLEQNFNKTYTPEQRQRYLEKGGSPVLDGEYTVFGEVVEGIDVIDKIAAVPTGQANRPARDVRMTVKVIDK
ncbi:MAG: peptidylprolyl isomerase [Phaeodactylibacter sp.]|uniref:peptidylprolyl isomerase n=1 Tax=Phaeodactylibacter sp. TaxID=1940289 RepID=UPI0032EF4D22